jgi:hypothetical protein
VALVQQEFGQINLTIKNIHKTINKMKLFIIITLSIFFVSLQSCTPEYGKGGSSVAGSSRSHNMGKDCMNCHKPGGGEAPTWKVAGTVYNPTGTTTNSNSTIKLFTGPNGTGTLKYTLSVDTKGNFYSDNADFTGGLYPVATGNTSTNYMSSPITNGACNSCHNGTTTRRIWAN